MTDPRVELRLANIWTDITAFTYQRDPISITRGRSDEAGKTDPGRCSLTVNNRDGRFSPRNPRGPYFGTIGRNTPIRVYVRHGGRALLSPGVEDRDRATTPDSAELSGFGSATGDIDIRVDATAHHWAATGLASKYEVQGDQRSWAFYVQPGGELAFAWSTDGTIGNRTVVQSTDLIVTSAGRRALRVTLDVSLNVVTFYTADTIAGPWTQLGDPVDLAGSTSIFDSTAELEVGHLEDIGGLLPISGRIHAFQLRTDIDGAEVANPDFSVPAEGTTSFTDPAGNTWTLQGETEITDKRYRFHGEVSEWPQRWDISDSDVYAQVEAAGILRRLAAGADPLKSALRRELTSPDAANPPVAYWPCEDGRRAEEIASALDSGRPMTITGSPRLAADSSFVCSEPLPTMGSAIFKGRVPRYDVTGQTQARFLLSVPDTGAGDAEKIVTIDTTGTVQRWDLQYSTIGGGGLHLLGFDDNNTQVANSNASDFVLDGAQARVSLEFTQNGPDIDFDVAVLKVGSFATLTNFSTAAGHTFGRILRVSVNPGRNLGDVTIGHISVHNQITSIFDLDSLDGFTGEPPGERMQRLAGEEGIPVEIIGNPEGAPWLGPQLPVTLVDLFHEAAESDSGMLFEPRGQLAIGLRTHDSLYNQAPVVSLDYAAAQVAGAIEPVDDDQATRNDVTVSRQGGSSSRIIQTEGPLSTHRPPDGVGRYNTDVTVSAHHGEFLPHMAGWRVRLGTVDEARYPRITADFATPSVSGDPDLVDALLFLDVGDRLTITNPPPWLPPEQISQIVQGYTETFDSSPQHTMTFNCSPEAPHRVAELDQTGNTASRYGPGSTSRRIVEDFEDADLAVELSGTWARASDSVHTGSWSLKSADIGDNETTDAVVQVPDGARWMRFWYSTDTELDFDFFRVLIDGAQVFETSGFNPWTQSAIFDVTGANEVTFRYVKDVSFSDPVDAAWIDDLEFGGTGSRLDVDVSISATSLSVETVLGPLWTTDPGEFPLDVMVGGERMTVAGIAGTSSPQTFTVSGRGVNGIVKSHPAGTPVELFQPAHRAL